MRVSVFQLVWTRTGVNASTIDSLELDVKLTQIPVHHNHVYMVVSKCICSYLVGYLIALFIIVQISLDNLLYRGMFNYTCFIMVTIL